MADLNTKLLVDYYGGAPLPDKPENGATLAELLKGASGNDPTRYPDGSGNMSVPAGGAVAFASVSVSSSQLKNLDSTPVQIVAAPGAGKMIMLLNASLAYLYGTTPYTNIDSPSLFTGNIISGPNWGMAEFGVMFALSRSEYGQIRVCLNDHDPLALFVNQGIYLMDDQAWAGGDGTAIISVAYAIVSTA